MPVQNLGQEHQDVAAPGLKSSFMTAIWRIAVFGPTISATLGLLGILWTWFKPDGLTVIEICLIFIISFSFFWILLTLFTVLIGIFSLTHQQTSSLSEPETPLRVALLVPIYNEAPWYVFGNIHAILNDLRRVRGRHHFDIYILSDTRDDTISTQELQSIKAIRTTSTSHLNLYYRRRHENTERKVGNIADWVRRWGAGYEAMMILDADSLMTSEAICRLTDALAQDPSTGLIQSFPKLVGAQTLFARAQQFANGVFGSVFAEGLSRWYGQEANYWGHNAIIRTHAFAACAGLPTIRRWPGRDDQILSHDFVEASLLRRSGWGVRFLNRIRGSYEETPSTLIDHIKRDRRWCYGNLQHLNLLQSSGLHVVSRFHLFHGAMGYLLSTLWLLLLIIWALIGNGQDQSVLTYFSPENPIIPTWPDMIDERPLVFLILMYATLLAPKLLGIMSVPLTGVQYQELGGVRCMSVSFVYEIIVSLLYAPIIMVQHVIAVFRYVLRFQSGWQPQSRTRGQYSLYALLTFHVCETVIGLALVLGILSGFVTPWLILIAVSLFFAVPLSALSGCQFPERAKYNLGTAETFSEPNIVRLAKFYRTQLKAHLEAQAMTSAE